MALTTEELLKFKQIREQNPASYNFLKGFMAEGATLDADIGALTARMSPTKGYTPTVEDVKGSPFDTKYRVDPATGQYVGSPVDASGRPIRPEFVSIGDTKTGLLQEPYQLKDMLDRSGYEAFMGEALRTPGTQSKWAQMAQAQGLNQLAQSQAGQLAQAKSGLAMQGGLRGGQRERLAAQGAQAGLLGGQKLRSDIAMQDEQKRMQLLQQAPGVALQQAQYDQGLQKYNIGAALGELAQKRAYDAGVYGDAMKAWGAEKTAQASGGGGGGKK